MCIKGTMNKLSYGERVKNKYQNEQLIDGAFFFTLECFKGQ